MAAMSDSTTANLAGQLMPDVYHDLIHKLRAALPSPPTDSPEDRARRDRAAIAKIAALCPANAAEADIAALYVAASEQWKECLRLAQQPERSFHGALKYRTQANSMMRQAQSALRLLLRMQATRQKLEADSEARDRAAWTEHCAIALMTEALSPPPTPVAAEPPAPPPAAEPQPAPAPRPLAGGRREEGAASDRHHAAHHDAAIHPSSAASIRPTAQPPDDDLRQAA